MTSNWNFTRPGRSSCIPLSPSGGNFRLCNIGWTGVRLGVVVMMMNNTLVLLACMLLLAVAVASHDSMRRGRVRNLRSMYHHRRDKQRHRVHHEHFKSTSNSAILSTTDGSGKDHKARRQKHVRYKDSEVLAEATTSGDDRQQGNPEDARSDDTTDEDSASKDTDNGSVEAQTTSPRKPLEKESSSDADTVQQTELHVPEIVVDIGERVIVHNRLLGTVMFVGTTSFAPGAWVGVSLDDPKGKNNGTVKGRTYFTCPAKHGLFTRPKNVVRFNEGGGNTDKQIQAGAELSIQGRDGEKIVVHNLQDLKSKYLHDLDTKMEKLMHKDSGTSKSSTLSPVKLQLGVGRPHASSTQLTSTRSAAQLVNPFMRPLQHPQYPIQRQMQLPSTTDAQGLPFVGTQVSPLSVPQFSLPPSLGSALPNVPVGGGLGGSTPGLFFNGMPVSFLGIAGRVLGTVAVAEKSKLPPLDGAYSTTDIDDGLKKEFPKLQLPEGKDLTARASMVMKNRPAKLKDLDSVLFKLLDHSTHYEDRNGGNIDDESSTKGSGQHLRKKASSNRKSNLQQYFEKEAAGGDW